MDHAFHWPALAARLSSRLFSNKSVRELFGWSGAAGAVAAGAALVVAVAGMAEAAAGCLEPD